MKVGRKRPSPAIAIAVIALIVTLTGTAYAALKPGSVGSRQLKPHSVTNAKFADSAIEGAKVAKQTLVGSDFNISDFATVPNVENATTTANSNLINGHAAACPDGTTLIRGTCYDSAPLGPVLGVEAAADACAERGGFLPAPGVALSLRNAIFLGDGNGTNSVFTDTFVKNTTGTEPGTTVVDNTGAKFVQLEDKITKELIATYHYICGYQLVR
jgi:hypothetical protein